MAKAKSDTSRFVADPDDFIWPWETAEESAERNRERNQEETEEEENVT